MKNAAMAPIATRNAATIAAMVPPDTPDAELAEEEEEGVLEDVAEDVGVDCAMVEDGEVLFRQEVSPVWMTGLMSLFPPLSELLSTTVNRRLVPAATSSELIANDDWVAVKF
jgi:hypothetical protein